MSESKTTQTKSSPGRHRRHRWLWVALPLAGLIAVASVVTAHGHRGGWGMRHGPFEPETAKEHVSFVASWVLEGIEAEEAQTEAVQGILNRAIDELAPMASVHRDNRERFHAELLAASIDREALEEIRRSQLELAEEASRILVDAVADVADQLTEEQRLELAEKAHRFHG